MYINLNEKITIRLHITSFNLISYILMLSTLSTYVSQLRVLANLRMVIKTMEDFSLLIKSKQRVQT